MRRFSHFTLATALGLTLTALTFGRSASALDDAVHVVTYVEVMPNSVESGSALLRRFRDASRAEDDSLRFDVLAEIARPTRFVIIEAWRDKGALAVHTLSTGTLQFRDQLVAIQEAPPDVRIDKNLYLEKGPSDNKTGALYVVTHVDVIPPGTEACLAALRAMSTDTAKDAGNIEYEVLQQADRANHFTVVEE